MGWKEKDNKARFQFGKALEESIQFHHDHDGEGALEDFKRRWAANQGLPLTYTDVEKNWENLNKIGSDMIRLYIAMQPKLPIPLGGRSVFQREYAKEVFQGDPNYGEIQDAGKLDIVCYADPEHPALPKITWDVAKLGPYRPLIVDIKTSAMDFPEQPGMAALDTQLRRYSWLSGIRDVALLWFKKSGTGYKKGYSVTFIESAPGYEPGDEGVIAKIEGDKAWVVKNDFVIAEIERVQGKKKDKNGNDRLDTSDEAKLRAENVLNQLSVQVSLDKLTRQRLQFNAGVVSKQSADDAGQIAGRQIISIVNAWQTKQWPNTFGIRYPHDDRNDSYFRAFVLNEKGYKEQNFIKSDEESFDDLFQEDE